MGRFPLGQPLRSQAIGKIFNYNIKLIIFHQNPYSPFLPDSLKLSNLSICCAGLAYPNQNMHKTVNLNGKVALERPLVHFIYIMAFIFLISPKRFVRICRGHSCFTATKAVPPQPWAWRTVNQSHCGKQSCGNALQIDYFPFAVYNILMSEIEIENRSEVQAGSNRFRSLQYKVKKPRAQLEDYDLREQIGEGGYGRVRKAVHKPTGQTVAVKILKVDQCDPEQVQSIEGEILLQQRLMHEHIAQIYEVVRREKKIYIFMEYCPNGQLFERIVKNGPMAEKEAAKVFHQILSALTYLKSMGVSHRDIKPENIIFDKDWNAKLVDFGFSCKSFADDDKMRKTVCGTPSYTPPEVLLKTSYSAELMDVWSLGATLYTMIAAEMPFDAETPEKKRAKIINCKWASKNFFSQRVQKLLAGIFVEPTKRLTLSELQSSQFMMAYQFREPNFIDHNKEMIIPEENIMSIMERDFGMEKRKVCESIKAYNLDKIRAHYYLTLAKQLDNQRNYLLDSSLSKYKKQRRSSLSKLDPIVRTPVVKRKDDSLLKVKKTEHLKIRRGSCNNIEAPTVRVRKERTPESPSKIMDNLALYM